MYESYWRLDRNPFDQDPDPQLFFASETHQAALLKLRYLIENRKGLGVLAGGTGVGKSFLSQVLNAQLEATQGPFVSLVYPCLQPVELLGYLARSLGISETPTRNGAPAVDGLIHELQRRLGELLDQGRHPVILIDDAHLIDDPELFQTLRLLLNFQPQRRTAFSLILLGQPELLVKLRRITGLESRVAVRSLLRPLTADETARYVQARLAAAGSQQEIFSSRTLQAVFELSGGLPRRINRLCDMALLVGYADDATQISPQQMTAVAEELEVAHAE